MENVSSEERMDRLMEKSRADASRMLVYTSRLKVLLKDSEIVELSVEKRSQELDVKEKELQSLSLDLEKRCKIFEMEKAEAGNFKNMVEDCSEELRSKENELKRIRRELFSEETRLGVVMAGLERHRNEACMVEGLKREMEREIDEKKTELAQILDQIKDRGKQFVTVDEQLESQRRQLGIASSELVSKEKELERVRELIKLSNTDLGMNEKKVMLLNNEIAICCQAIDTKSKELERILKLIEEQTRELDLLKLSIQELLVELLTKVERHKEISLAIDRSSSEMEERAKEIRAAETEASELHARSQKFRQDVEDREKRLESLKDQLEAGERKLVQLKREMEESTKVIKAAQFEANDLSVKSEKYRQEVEGKEKELDRLKNHRWSEERKLIQLKIEMDEGAKGIKAAETEARELNARSQRSRQDVEDKKKELDQLKREMEESAKGIKAEETEARDLSIKSGKFRQEFEGKEKELDRLKNQIESAEKKLIQVNREVEEVTNKKKKVLEVTVSKIQESGKQLVAANEKLESQQKLLESQSKELVSRDMELERVAESNKLYEFDLEEKEKRLQVLKDLITISSEQLDLKSKELEGVQKLIEEESKKLCDIQKQQASAAPIIDTSQQNAREAELVDEDTLTHFESSASLVHDVSSALRASPNPAEIVLDLVQDTISKGSGLEDSAVEILVLLFDELTKIQQSDQLANIQRPDQSQLQLKATELATLWKGKIAIEAPMSSLEALAFLQFIVAYELKKLINQEETVLLASSIAHYEQASTLFDSVGLKVEMITDIVFELINKRQYIPAIRFICKFKLTEFPPSHLLKKEITNLSQSVLEKRPTRCPQAKDQDGGKVRAILELLADYEELRNDLPKDLVAKLMVQRENSTPLARCSVTHVASSSSPQVNSNSPDLASARLSSVNLRIPKPEVKPCVNPSGSGRS